MNPKLLLCLALVLSGGLAGCSTTASHSSRTDAKESKQLYTRAYQINGNFYTTLDKRTHVEELIEQSDKASSEGGVEYDKFTGGFLQNALLQVLAAAAVNLQPPSSVYLNDGLGLVYVHGTQQECDAVKRVVEDLNGEPVADARR